MRRVSLVEDVSYAGTRKVSEDVSLRQRREKLDGTQTPLLS